MPSDADKKVIWKILGAAVGVFILVYLGISLFGHGPDERDAIERLDSIVEDIDVNTVTHEPMPVDIIPENLTDTLPDVDDSYPLRLQRPHQATSRYSLRRRKPGAAPTAG